MRSFLLGLRIRIKLLAAFGSLLLLSVLLIFFSIQSINRIIEAKRINEQVDGLKLRLEALDLAGKEFIYEGYKSESFLATQQAPSVTSFNENYTLAKETVMLLKQAAASSENVSSNEVLAPLFDSLHYHFTTLVALLQKRGFKDNGLEGELRSAIHRVENSSFTFDRVTMLMLRRHEKDFFLRKDVKYQQEFNQRLDVFRQQVTDPTLISLADDYGVAFNKVVTIEQQIGLSEKEGIRGKIHHYFERIRPQIEQLSVSVKERNEEQIARTKWILAILFAVQIVTGIAMALIYANLLTTSIKEIRGGMLQLAAGVFPEKLAIHTTEEIGETKQAFNQFIDRLRAAATFAGQLGEGKLNERYDDQYSNDVLAQSLIMAQDKLRTAEERQRKINWSNEGAAQFNTIFKSDVKEVRIISDQLLKFIVHYLNINQGAIYLLRTIDGDTFLERLATYAYGKKRFVDDRVQIGNGLLGQCVLEEETVYLKDIPSGFVKITSGLGEATPRNVVMVPLKTRHGVIGVIELASFVLLEQYQVEFIEQIAETSAMLLSEQWNQYQSESAAVLQ